MAMRALNAISSPLSVKGHTAALAALNSRSSLQCHSRVGFRAGERSWSIQRERTICSVAGRAARGAAVPVASVSATEISQGKLENSGDSYFLTDARPVILFDGVCNMCNGGVNFMLDNDKEGKLRFAALQSEAGRALLVKSGRAADDISSIVLVDEDRSYIKSEAILRIGQFLNFPYSPAAFLGLIVPMFLRDALYNTVADNRYSVFGKSNACRLSDPRFEERFIE
ncbi:unnamed protein product [Calypogeia fissa]